ncbi:MAG TPA: uracil-DNA glycosylase [Gemmatimonadales bacterium]|nr:uracil-DNA glycosylase [Gemmatimonadales bacterium]
MAIRPSDHLAILGDQVARCTACPRLTAWCRSIASEKKREFRNETYWGRPVPSFGDPDARLLIVGLAPAAHGANRTGRMFTGDSSGAWLWEALHRFGFADRSVSLHRTDGLRLTNCWITAAARCAPPDNKPQRAELERCRRFLIREIALLAQVRVVVALGRIAYESWLRATGWWDRLPARDRPSFTHGGETVLPDGRILITSFHPSRQNTNTGRLTRAMWHRVFRRAAALADPAVTATAGSGGADW